MEIFAGTVGVFVVVFAIAAGIIMIFMPFIIYGMWRRLVQLVKIQEAQALELRGLRKATDDTNDLIQQLGNAVLEELADE